MSHSNFPRKYVYVTASSRNGKDRTLVGVWKNSIPESWKARSSRLAIHKVDDNFSHYTIGVIWEHRETIDNTCFCVMYDKRLLEITTDWSKVGDFITKWYFTNLRDAPLHIEITDIKDEGEDI